MSAVGCRRESEALTQRQVTKSRQGRRLAQKRAAIERVSSHDWSIHKKELIRPHHRSHQGSPRFGLAPLGLATFIHERLFISLDECQSSRLLSVRRLPGKGAQKCELQPSRGLSLVIDQSLCEAR